MKRYERNSGIALITLIITIALLIILAGVGIGVLVNQDGLIDKADEAKIATEKKDIEEQINIMRIHSIDEHGNLIRETLRAKLENLPEGTKRRQEFEDRLLHNKEFLLA